MIENSLIRVAAACQVDEFIEDIFCQYREEKVTGESVDNLKLYLKNRKIPIPKYNDDEEFRNTIKIMYIAWASLECLNLMCELNGEEL